MSIQIYYNKELFRKAGLDPEKPPKTWKAFIAAGEQLNKKGIPALSIGFGDLWMIGAFLEPYAFSYLGAEKLKGSMLGKVPYTDPAWEKVLKCFTDLKDHDLLVKGCVTSPNKESEQLFSGGLCAMIMNGSWGVSVFKGMNPNLDYGVMRLPKPDDATFPMHVRGGVGSGASVTQNSKHQKEAVEFLKWLTNDKQQTSYANQGLDLPANRNCTSGLIPVLRPFSASMNDLLPDLQVSEKYAVQEVLWKGIQSILIGESNPKEVLAKVHKAKQNSMAGR